jgi:hypothetical protein
MKIIIYSLVFAFGLSGMQAVAEKPNVVLIVCDDLNDYITGIPGGSGHPQTITPNVEKLAKSGVAFRRAYSNNPVCAPSRSSFMTGIPMMERRKPPLGRPWRMRMDSLLRRAIGCC